MEFSTIEGGRFNRCEFFDEADLDKAIAKFDQLSRPAPRLENAASQMDGRFWSYFTIRDWDAMAELLSDDIDSDDRRKVVGAGIRHGRDAEIANVRAAADVGTLSAALRVIAVRGQRVSLSRIVLSGKGQQPDAFGTEVLGIIEIDESGQIVARLVFDVDDIDAAFADLDARYQAGEAAAHADTWSVITNVFVAHNRREIAPLTADLVSLDHRRAAAFAPGEGMEYILAGWDLDQSLHLYIETAHRLNDLGAVFTWAGHGTSHEGFEAEWRGVQIMTVDGNLLSRAEVFDEADLDAAIAKFDQLSMPARRLENTASQVYERFWTVFAARDWDVLAALLANDISYDDRRPVVGAGVRHGRATAIEDVRSLADVGTGDNTTSTVIATRGRGLTLNRMRGWAQSGFEVELLSLVELSADEKIAAIVLFDIDDFDAAVTELDARYLAGEAAAHAHTWTLVTQAYAALNRRQLPPTAQDWTNIDHRRLARIATGDLGAYLHATWQLSPHSGIYIETVHRLNEVGAVVTHVVKGTSQQGFDAEWRTIDLSMYEGDQIKRSELFDEADLEAAIARFDEVTRPALKNAASKAWERISDYVAARDWVALAGITSENICVDDRRRVVNAGIINGRDANIERTRALAEVGFTLKMLSVIATRGARLTLIRVRAAGHDPESIANDALNIVEVDFDGRVVADIIFDLADIDAAFAELDARYLAGEAAGHAHTWSVIAGAVGGDKPSRNTGDNAGLCVHRPSHHRHVRRG